MNTFNALVIGSISVVSAKPLTLNESDSWAIANALRAAAHLYKKDSESVDENVLGRAAAVRLRAAFDDQAEQAYKLAVMIESVL